MGHQHIREEKIVDYVLGNLSSKEHFQVNAHLAFCKRCASEYDHWKKYLNVETTPIPSKHLKHKIFKNIQQKRNRLNNKYAYIAVSFCITLILCIGMFQFAKSKPISDNDHSENLIAQHEELLYLMNQHSNNYEPIEQLNQVENHNIMFINNHYNDKLYINEIDKLYAHPMKTSDLWYRHPYQQSEERIIFINNDAICSYEIQQKRITCVQTRIDPNTNKLIPIDSKIFYLHER